MADFTILASGSDTNGVTTSDTTASITPAVGDIIFWGGKNSNGDGASVSGGGMTWTQLHAPDTSGGSVFACAFEATAGTPSTGALTLSATNNFSDTSYVIVRPVDLDTATAVGNGDSGGSNVGSLTVPITGSGFDGLLAYFIADGNRTWTADTGWTEILDQNNTTDVSHQLQERFSDDTEVTGTPSGNERLVGLVVSFAATGGGGALIIIAHHQL